jgi:hypothetical protein
MGLVFKNDLLSCNKKALIHCKRMARTIFEAVGRKNENPPI